MKIVYLWGHISQATKLQMRCFRGPRNYILDAKSKYMLQKDIFLANLCQVVDIQVPLWSHFLNLIICLYFVTKCFSEAYILILHPKCSSGDP